MCTLARIAAQDAVTATTLSNFNSVQRFFPGFFVGRTFAANGQYGGAAEASSGAR